MEGFKGLIDRAGNAVSIVTHSLGVAFEHVLTGKFKDIRNPQDRSCIRCTGEIEDTVVEHQVTEEVRRGVCRVCKWVDWDPPVPVVVGLVVFPKKYIGGTDVEGPFDFNAEDYRIPSETGVVIIKRAAEPFKGGLALPGGYIMKGETPVKALVDEISQEIGINARVERFLHPCNPLPGRLNQTIQHGLARPVNGRLVAGDDAAEVHIVGSANLPPLCFSSHDKTVKDYFAGNNGIVLGRKQYP